MCNGNIGYPKRSCLVKRDGRGNFSVDGVDMSALSPELYSCICKLKDYEASGLSPDDVETVKQLYDGAVETINGLRAEIAEMKKKLVELPVRPGDVIYDCWQFMNPDIEHPTIERMEVSDVTVTSRDGRYEYRARGASSDIARRLRREDFGKIVFLDPEKAKSFAERCINERNRT